MLAAKYRTLHKQTAAKLLLGASPVFVTPFSAWFGARLDNPSCTKLALCLSQ
jgi:hypothetical protein